MNNLINGIITIQTIGCLKSSTGSRKVRFRT